LRPHAYHASRRFTPSTASLVSFNQVRSRDQHPTELDLTAVAQRLSTRALPLAVDHAGPLSTMLRSPVLRANSKLASLQGISRYRLGATRRCYPALAAPGSLGFSLLGALPFHALDLHGAHAILCRLPCCPATLRTKRVSARRRMTFGPSFSHFRKGSLTGPLLPVPQSFKEQWKLAFGLFRDRRPLRGLGPHPVAEAKRVSDQTA